jgi:hypothetical protein
MIAAKVPAVVRPVLEDLVHETAEKVVLEARDVQDNIRCATEEGMVQTRAAYDRLKHAAEEVTDTLESSYVKVTRGFGELNQKAIEGLKAHAEANFEHFKALAAAKSYGWSETNKIHFSRAIIIQPDREPQYTICPDCKKTLSFNL